MASTPSSISSAISSARRARGTTFSRVSRRSWKSGRRISGAGKAGRDAGGDRETLRRLPVGGGQDGAGERDPRRRRRSWRSVALDDGDGGDDQRTWNGPRRLHLP